MNQDALLRAADNAGVFEGSQQLGRCGDVNAQYAGMRSDVGLASSDWACDTVSSLSARKGHQEPGLSPGIYPCEERQVRGKFVQWHPNP